MRNFVERFKPRLDRIRAIPGEMGMRPHAVSVVIGNWSGPNTGDGGSFNSETPLTVGRGQNPKVRWLSNEELAVGSLPKGSAQIGPITPTYGSGGLDLASLADVNTGSTRYVKITGPQHPNGAYYRITRVDADRSLHYTLTAEPTSDTLAT